MCYFPKHVVLNILLLHISHHVFPTHFSQYFCKYVLAAHRNADNMTSFMYKYWCFLHICPLACMWRCVLWSCVCVLLNPCLYFPLIGASPGNRPNSLCIGAPEKCCQCERQGHLVTTVSLYFIIDRGLSLGSCLTDKNKTKKHLSYRNVGFHPQKVKKEAQLENFWNYSNCIQGVTKVSGTDYSL